MAFIHWFVCRNMSTIQVDLLQFSKIFKENLEKLNASNRGFFNKLLNKHIIDKVNNILQTCSEIISVSKMVKTKNK